MKSKLEKAIINLEDAVNTLQCPLCHSQMIVENKSLQCQSNHTYNINRKGYVTLAQPMNDKIYNHDLFAARKSILNSDIYAPVHATLAKIIDSNNNVVIDLGSGEGTYLHKLAAKNPSNTYLGVDLAKDGINLATDYEHINWLLADLSQLPVKDSSIDYCLNILSPANYKEINRILKPNGHLIKIIVQPKYLKELRMSTDQKAHSNENVIQLLEQNMDIIEQIHLDYKAVVSKDLQDDLNLMSPLTKQYESIVKLDEISIELLIIVAQKRK